MKVLFMCPDYFGIYSIIEKEITDSLKCDLKTVVFKDYKYKNNLEKLQNFLSKTFLKKNLKKIWASQQHIKSIKEDDFYDIVFIICPDFLLDNELEFIRKRAKKTIVYFWDSFKNIKGYERTLKYFDIKYSFEPRDVKKYDLNLLTNFYYNTTRNDNSSNDLYYIGTFDERITTIEKIINSIEINNLKILIILISRKQKIKQKYQSNFIKFLDKPITFTENEKIYNDSKIILDVHKPIQNGLTFRVFEAIGKGKKIITTNKDIVNYDFYNPANIFVWSQENKKIPIEFFTNKYEELPADILANYNVKNWVKTIFNEQNN